MARKKATRSIPKPQERQRWHATPLKNSFMALSILGFFITAYLIYPTSGDYGFAFMIVFLLMFIASLVSMTKASVVEDGRK